MPGADVSVFFSHQSIGWATGVAPIAVATALDPLRVHKPQTQTDIRTEGRGATDYL